MPAVARQTPVGAMLEDGHSTKVTLSNDPDISFWEDEVTPPGIDDEGENDVTTMHNLLWRTRAPKKLQTLTPLTAVVGYDPRVLPQIIAQRGQNQEITVWFSDGSNWVFWGWVSKFTL